LENATWKRFGRDISHRDNYVSHPFIINVRDSANYLLEVWGQSVSNLFCPVYVVGSLLPSNGLKRAGHKICPRIPRCLVLGQLLMQFTSLYIVWMAPCSYVLAITRRPLRLIPKRVDVLMLQEEICSGERFFWAAVRWRRGRSRTGRCTTPSKSPLSWTVLVPIPPSSCRASNNCQSKTSVDWTYKRLCICRRSGRRSTVVPCYRPTSNTSWSGPRSRCCLGRVSWRAWRGMRDSRFYARPTSRTSRDVNAGLSHCERLYRYSTEHVDDDDDAVFEPEKVWPTVQLTSAK